MTTENANRRLSDWFRQWRLPLRRFLLGKVNVRATDVDDVAQEVFLRLMRYDKGELIDHPQAYLYKIASNIAAEWSIRAANRSRHDAKWLVHLTGGEEPDSVLQVTLAQAEIKRALSTLPPEQREVLKLYYTEELSHAEISQRTGEPLRRVRRHVARGYETLRHALDPDLLRMDEGGVPVTGEKDHGRD